MCEWQGCDLPSTTHSIHCEEGVRDFDVCIDHAAQLYESLTVTWGPLSDAGDLHATVLLVLLWRRVRPFLSFRLGMRAIRYAWRAGDSRTLWNVTSAWVKL